MIKEVLNFCKVTGIEDHHSSPFTQENTESLAGETELIVTLSRLGGSISLWRLTAEEIAKSGLKVGDSVVEKMSLEYL